MISDLTDHTIKIYVLYLLPVCEICIPNLYIWISNAISPWGSSLPEKLKVIAHLPLIYYHCTPYFGILISSLKQIVCKLDTYCSARSRPKYQLFCNWHKGTPLVPLSNCMQSGHILLSSITCLANSISVLTSMWGKPLAPLQQLWSI